MPANRLIHSTSPYLLQHAHNPVDWYPWGEEALARARAEDKPVFLSVGYAACHWCHVMERESFENEAIAEVLNQHFVSIKVDREERPDLDATYMLATQLMTSRGGWPNSLWLLPDGRPWYAGTYFPPDDQLGRVGFRSLLLKLADIWSSRRREVDEQARQLTEAIRQQAEPGVADGATPDAQTLAGHALAHLQDTYDAQHGGFGEAPKFPPHAALALLLAQQARQPDSTLAQLSNGTLRAMQRGGLHDHLGGGFHRYATDAGWLVPHFEKMLYDNAQLARLYAEAWRQTGEATYRSTAEHTLDWILRDLSDAQGGFHSSLDADSEGEEGRFYTWSHEEVLRELGPEDGPPFCEAYRIKPHGNFDEEASGRPTGLNIPHLTRDPADPGAFANRLAHLRRVRDQRVWPGRDDKVITSWNGLMIGALAFSGRVLGRPDYLAAAKRAAGFLLEQGMCEGVLTRSWRAGACSGPGFLEDYGALAEALFELHEASGEPAWAERAVVLTRQMVDRFHVADPGLFRGTASDHGTQLAELYEVFDQAMPSASSLALKALQRAARHTGEAALLALATANARALLPRLARLPHGGCALLATLA